LLEQAQRYFGFVPNLLATLAHSPSALKVYLNAYLGFQYGTLTPAEQQIVLLTASKENECGYCTSSHSALARFFANVPVDAIIAIECGSPLSDTRLNALVNLTRQLVGQRGHVPRKTVDTFIEAGYSKDQLLEVLVGVGLKTISNYFDHVSEIEIDSEFQRPV
jgi:AhpD family alkylhydroperoxidase